MRSSYRCLVRDRWHDVWLDLKLYCCCNESASSPGGGALHTHGTREHRGCHEDQSVTSGAVVYRRYWFPAAAATAAVLLLYRCFFCLLE